MTPLEEYRQILGDGYTDEELEAIYGRYDAIAQVLIDWYVEDRGQKPEESR